MEEERMPAAERDTVVIRGARVEASIGCTEAERAVPQLLEVDLDLGIPPWDGGTELARSVCYATAVELVRAHTGAQPWILVEELALSLIGAVFERFPPARSATITIKKFVVPGTEWCGVRMTRMRADF